MTRLLKSIGVITFLAFPGHTSAAAKTDPARAFRESHPLHFQGLALGEAGPDGTRILLIAEPPPDATLEQIRDILPPGTEISIQETPIGRTGALRDVVAVLPAGSAPTEVIDDTSSLLFGTAYKAYAVPLKDSGEPPRGEGLDLTVTSADLRSWLVDKPEPFRSVSGGPFKSMQSVTASTQPGTFISQAKGLVVWWIPKGVSVGSCRASFRQFALDSDLIVGALAVDQGLLIAGRERQASVLELPPLRFETARLLGSVGGSSLQQSYDRNHPLAGPMSDGKDWAPIHLSSELVDSEYGSLLNVTDQLLKGWTNAGLTQYENFRYANPRHWPFSGPLIMVMKATQLTYNWNTAGAGYVVPAGRGQVFALNRTGALPITYLPGHGPDDDDGTSTADRHDWKAWRDAEDTAYSYFASSSDPNLIRVAEYGALYQILHAFKPAKERMPLNPEPEDLLVRRTQSLLASIQQMSPTERTRVSKRIAASLQRQYDGIKVPEGMVQEAIVELQKEMSGLSKGEVIELAELIGAPRRAERQARKLIMQVRGAGPAEMDKLIAAYSDKVVRADPQGDHAQAVATTSAEIRHLKEVLSEGSDDHLTLELAGHIVMLPKLSLHDKIEELGLLAQVSDSQNFWQGYAASGEARPGAGWLRTPVVVVSSNNGVMAGATGGHDIHARVVRFRTDPKLKEGQFELHGKGEAVVVALSPADAGVEARLSRSIGRDWDSRQLLNKEIADKLRRPQPVLPRDFTTALALVGAREARGFDFREVPEGRAGWRAGSVPDAAILAHASLSGATVTVEQLGDSGYRIHLADRAVDAFTSSGVADFLRNDSSLPPEQTVALKGFSEVDSERLADTLGLRAGPKGRGALRILRLDDALVPREVTSARSRSLSGQIDPSSVTVQPALQGRGATVEGVATDSASGTFKARATILIKDLGGRAGRLFDAIGRAFARAFGRVAPSPRDEFEKQFYAELDIEMKKLGVETNTKLQVLRAGIRDQALDSQVAEDMTSFVVVGRR